MKEELKPMQAQLRSRLSKNLKRLRATQKISQEALADLAGLHRTYVSQVERMITNISLDNIGQLADALQVDAAELLAKIEGEEEPVAAVSRPVKKTKRVSPKI
ncbi:helix-turn-helix transcriptional regulator [Paraburkholderia madseniana]|uniref:helix-turn-helix domain-containing protein n=1 Tax=Paraburkholderia madseniana TaxID=2599607 RepID=UPI001559589A|nr:helix-turn-helix transcriptional regulator [Paraburkholderia madseniana]NPT70790.1 helix-turn-helix domain-containing protein [Paraburkholderia madseniana]